jgi:anti-sigma factor NepR-like protein
MNASGSDNNKTEDEARGERGAADGAPAVDASIQGILGRKLRENYEEVVKEAVPDKFLLLLDELKKKEKGAQKDGGS